ncbi:MAG TPA: hypothetical protein VD768_03915 [Sphingomicrobium sp.]|nr:hypothetical protein [Sphingomicrobium sp.]
MGGPPVSRLAIRAARTVGKAGAAPPESKENATETLADRCQADTKRELHMYIGIGGLILLIIILVLIF